MGLLLQNVVLTANHAFQLDIIKPISHRSSSAIITGHSRINLLIITVDSWVRCALSLTPTFVPRKLHELRY